MVIKGALAGHSDIMGQLTQENFLVFFSEVYRPFALNVYNGSMGGLMADGSAELADIRWSDETVGLMQYAMKFSGIMSDECANPNSDIRMKLEQCMRYEIVNDWTPRHPVALYQSTGDPVIPFKANTQSTYDKFLAAGVDVTLAKTDGMDHLVAQMMWSIRLNTLKEYKNRIE